MAKKSRTPPPPRRPVQAPQRRVDKHQPADDRRKLMLLVLFAAAGLVALGVVIVVIAFTGGGSGGSGDVAAAMTKAGCTFNTYPQASRKHTNDPNSRQKDWNSFPPTSGTHYFQPAPWSLYTDPVSEPRLLHNLEHGGVVIQYGKGVPSSSVAQIADFYRGSPNAMVIAPLPQLGSKIALSAWTHLALCARWNGGAAKAFRDAFRGKGPERFPIDALRPGT